MHLLFFITIFVLKSSFCAIFAYATEYYYAVEVPYRDSLQEQYVDEDNDIYYTKKITINDLKTNYLKKRNQINTDEKNTKKDKELKYAIASTAEAIGNPITTDEQQKIAETVNNKQSLSKKTDEQTDKTSQTSKSSWIDSWLVYKDVKPMDYLGAYSIFKLLFTWPASMKFSANEVRTIGTSQVSAELFSGKASMGFMPSFFISAGNDRMKFWRWEVEVGYIPLRVSKITSFEVNTTDNPGSSFSVSRKQLGSHLINLNFNNYFQYAFFDKSIVGFIGLGLGIGYVWSYNNRLSSNFVLPVISLHLGCTFMISKTRKMNISYRLSYMDFNINNKYGWKDSNKVLSDNRTIISGKTSFKELFISAVSIEYMFYIN